MEIVIFSKLVLFVDFIPVIQSTVISLIRNHKTSCCKPFIPVGHWFARAELVMHTLITSCSLRVLGVCEGSASSRMIMYCDVL